MIYYVFFSFNDTATTEIYTLSLHDALPISHLRNVYQKMHFTNSPGAQSITGFGIVHDGTDPSLFTFLSRPVFGTFANNTTIKNNLSAFVQCLDTGTAPCVGYSRTVTPANFANT